MDQPDEQDLAEQYRPLLGQERLRLLEQSRQSTSARQPVTLDQTMVGRLSRMDALQDQAMAKAVEARRAGRIRAIDAALERIEEGEFGFCEDCGCFIGFGRLDVDPTAMRCVSCAG